MQEALNQTKSGQLKKQKNILKNLKKGIQEMTKFDTEKILKENINFNDDLNEHLKDVNEQALWMQTALEEYLKDGNFDAFYACLEKIIEVRDISVRKMSKDLELSRSNIIKLLGGQTKTAPKIDTLVKIFDYLNFEIKIQPKQA